MIFDTAKTLIVVYKDEMLNNQLRKLVESNDDTNEDIIIGTKDDTIQIVSWEEPIWMANKKAGNIQSKVLFLGDVKDTDKLIPVIDVKFDEFGVRYGWAGNQGVVYADVKELHDKDKHKAFLEKMEELKIPEEIKPRNNTIKKTRDDEAMSDALEDSKVVANVIKRAKKVVDTGKNAVVKTVENADDFLNERAILTRQMLFYGVINLYEKDLETFMHI